MNDNLNAFVKSRLEEDEGISPESLAKLLSAARARKTFGMRRAFLLAASLTLVCCGWLVYNHRVTQREADLTNVIALLQTADGVQMCETSSLAESLLAWQDAPCLEFVN